MYNHNLIEKKWQQYWADNKTFTFVDRHKSKFYVLDMFPYPSGKGLHVGHLKGYTPTDVLSRFKRLNDFDVLHPIGWDAFGLPAEQYAIDTNNHPAVFTEQNIKIFRSQLQKYGFDYDYQKEVNTTDPKFYQWTQWIFIQLYKHGLAEIKLIDVNWCEGLKTTLSNEEVLTDEQGRRVSERGSFPVVKKPMQQWVLKITKYADRLLDDLELVDWPESLKALQRNWIGRTTGYEFIFDTIKDIPLKIFTTRLDTLYGVCAIVISPKHPLVDHLKHNQAVQTFIEYTNTITDLDLKIHKDKNGVDTGLSVRHPLTQATIPIWIADYVLNDVGTGAVMVVPDQDERDYEFAKKYQMDFIPIIDKANHYINSPLINGLNQADAIKKLSAMLHATAQTNYKLKDWVFSRQRYWGEPFPVMFDEQNQIHVCENLPLLLPDCEDFKPCESGLSPLAKIDAFMCQTINHKKYKFDCNTMPQWAGSCWYYLAYLLKQTDGNYLPLNSPEAFKLFEHWLPVDVYVGGQEHAVLHLLYSRFWHKFLFDIGIVPTAEPFYKIINQGLILGPDGTKMSKSKGNVINPDEIVNSHGADALRIYECFMGPITASFAWSENGLDGARKWLDRVYRYYCETPKTIVSEEQLDETFRFTFHNFIKKFGDYVNTQQFNLAISEMMICLNAFYKHDCIAQNYLDSFVIALSCYAPHLAEELWHTELKNEKSVSHQQWPAYNPQYLIQSQINLPFQINGKLKTVINVPIDASDDEIIALVEADAAIAKILEKFSVTKKIIVKNKIINYIGKEK